MWCTGRGVHLLKPTERGKAQFIELLGKLGEAGHRPKGALTSLGQQAQM